MKTMTGHAATACAVLAMRTESRQSSVARPEHRFAKRGTALCAFRGVSGRGLTMIMRKSGKAEQTLSTRASRRLRIVADRSDNGGAVDRRRPRNANQVVDMEDILAERDACGVGFIANLENTPSHKTLADALTGLSCMEHRGGCSSDDISGDGSGVMTQVPWKLLQDWAKSEGLEDGAIDPNTTGVGMVFLSQESEMATKAISMCEDAAKECGFEIVGWRDVPVDSSVCGKWATKTLPQIKQLIIKSTTNETGAELERSFYLCRKKIEWSVREQDMDDSDLHFCSLSNASIVYKGMLYSSSLGIFYKDLENPLYESVFAIYHRRFSTNTLPKWHLAQPMRFLGHNGEINTVQGNLNWVSGREDQLKESIFADHGASLTPISNSQLSDSGNLDRMAELLVLSGKDPEEAMMILVPEAYKNHPDLESEAPELANFYEFYSGLQEPWDGPALLVFSDGKKVGACLDRNGLRPARYWKSSEGFLYVASEVGVIPCDPATVTMRGRLGPGQMVSVDLETGSVSGNLETKSAVASKQPYSQWLSASRQVMPPAGFLEEKTMSEPELMNFQTAFGYGSEDVQLIIESMAMSGKEPTYCMGDDAPLAVLSEKPHLIYNYFKQRFAQVTNPAIDPLREGLVMGVEMFIGAKGNIFATDLSNEGRQLKLKSPVLSEKDLTNLEQTEFLKPTKHQMIVKPDQTLKEAVQGLCTSVEKEVRAGSQCVILSDRVDASGLSGESNIPALLATGAVHHHLIAEGVRMNTSIVVETAQCFSTHHFATLIGYGASAICPYLALETCRAWQTSKRTQTLIQQEKIENVSIVQSQENYRKAINSGLKKILSKMGISLLSSYHGAQIFEIYGLGDDVVDLAFKGTVSRIGGLSMEELETETKAIWCKAFGSNDEIRKLENFGFIKFVRAREHHGNNPEMSKLLHQAVRKKDEELFNSYQKYLQDAPVSTLRDTLELISSRQPISIDEVEPITKIVERFCTGGMSLGAISRECHEVIAIAMNRLGGKSNSGEGGEDANRFKVVEDVDKEGTSGSFPYLRGIRNGDIATSKIKQVASGRFGVSAYFLSQAEQIEIKIAQGAKPGEGGQLPGKKVSEYIAKLRKSKPGVQLISPPPHHDIYSIEDLAQLIYDLHQVNERAKVSVKLVSEAGIGTVASGVAKAGADVIQVSGHDGGTGASPISSIKHAGGPWEMGLVETHQTLVDNELRNRVILRVDGGLKNGRDIVIAAALGADEFGFGTVAMIATGCIMARICHTNDCPVGVASQREELRARFPGTPEDVVNFFCFLAEEVRQRLADLGYKSLDEIIGNTEILRVREDMGASKTDNLDLGFILQSSEASSMTSSERRSQPAHSNGELLDDEVLSRPSVKKCLEEHTNITEEVNIINTDRSFCTRIAGKIASIHGDDGFKGQLNLEVHGSAGQSFGAFMVKGMDVKLFGEANDYVCKSVSGGRMAIVPYENSTYEPSESAIVGNTCLYGATGGEVFIRGIAGERFAVRNSLGDAVVEGAGDHCCEYMTGGCVVVLGKIGRNMGAGMTGGIAYVYVVNDANFEAKVNKESVTTHKVESPASVELLKSMMAKHLEATGSEKAQSILANFSSELQNFRMLVPESERAILLEKSQASAYQNTQVVQSSS